MAPEKSVTYNFQSYNGGYQSGNEKQSPKCCRFFEDQDPDDHAAHCTNACPDCISGSYWQSAWSRDGFEHHKHTGEKTGEKPDPPIDAFFSGRFLRFSEASGKSGFK